MIKNFIFAFLILLIFITMNNCGDPVSSDDECDDDSTDTGLQPIVRKPNIYLYPEIKTELDVKIFFPNGGSITESDPPYGNGWHIIVDSTGKINNEYDYLFYECKTPDLYQYDKGWVVTKDSLQIFFEDNLAKTGFNEKEIKDFIDYWIPLFDLHDFYTIYPQYADDIAPVVQLDFSKFPDSILRLFYVIIEGAIDRAKISESTIPEFERTGFVVAEWGVVLK